MKTPKLKLVLPLIFISFLIFNCSKSNSPEEDNNPPGLFSVNTVDTTVDAATIVWTVANDFDDDFVTYTIFLEGQEKASVGPLLTYKFTGLESETSYVGYVEARDGRGGTSKADFFFTTKPEVLILTVVVKEFLRPSTSTACPINLEISAGVLVPKYSGNVTYNLSFGPLSLNNGGTIVASIGRSWTNDNYSTYYIYDYDADYYFVWQAGAGGCSTSPNNDNVRAFYASASGQATLIVTKN